MPGQSSDFSNQERSHQLPSNLVAQEFGEVNVRKVGQKLEVLFTILMEPQGQEAEGWQTGVALDASASMRGWYGRNLIGKIPEKLNQEYQKKGWIEVKVQDGKRIKIFEAQAYEDAIKKGHFKYSDNIVQPLAQEFIAYLGGNLDADGGTTVIYWAGGDGSKIEVLGDFTQAQCQQLEVNGPKSITFGQGTSLTPAVKYFVERFVDAQRGMYVFITDGKLDDLKQVKNYTTKLAKEIKSGQRNPVKCVLIGVGNEIDRTQLEELDDLSTESGIDIWDYKIAEEMSALVQIFAEVVDENQIVAPTAMIYDSAGNIVKRYTDGLPAKISLTLPGDSQWFELEVYGNKIRQTVVLPNN
ncbi:VWA domain-containing protein [Moorena producens JHB]|uniref:VWA domain-containing protein n=1 Tax=Moorena producens (strain JHB) TaxID=1454205 RepID=A0A1D9FZE9_MOOP1|nr:vWA domain-containing protein [Moorena producens]AOY80644.1 VWA domain-containing protein [Moorena producens JHB]